MATCSHCMHTRCQKMPCALASAFMLVSLGLQLSSPLISVHAESMNIINHSVSAYPLRASSALINPSINANVSNSISSNGTAKAINASNTNSTNSYGIEAITDTTISTNTTINSTYTICRCMPDSACWPSLDAWDQLNSSIGGQLVRPSPPAAPCYNIGPTQLNITACQIAAANWMNPFWRADQVGAMQYSNKEAHGNQSCSLLSSPIISIYGPSLAFGASSNASLFNSTLPPSTSSFPCLQGAVPTYAVEVLQSSHVQDAVTFAAQHNLRLSIKSTGHDALGRSTAPGSLNLWMHRMKNITFHSSFNPSGCDPDVTFPAVTAESGTQWGELYAAAEAKNLVIVGAMSASVSTGGGYLQGGGHSPLSPFLGMAADNVVEIKVVTADGRLQTANACQNQELFWALQGGGGGTFGVVISSTHIAYPALLNMVNVHLTATTSNATLFEELLTNFVYLQSSLSEDNFWAGYSYITSTPKPSLSINYLVPNCNTSIAEASFQSLLNFASLYPSDIVLNVTIESFPSFGTWHSQVLCKANPGICTDPSGLNTVLASRLLPQSVVKGKATQVAQAFMKILSQGVGQIVGHLVGGQGVAAGQNLAGQDRLSLLNKLGERYLGIASNEAAGQTETLAGRAAISVEDAEAAAGDRVDSSLRFAKAALRQYATSSGETDADNATNSVNPAFRSSLWHVVLLNVWGDGESKLDSQTLTQMNGLLRDLSPGSGCYLNEADVNEPNWQDAFYGQHYSRLQAIKERVDPGGVFTCTNCVGSEPWTTDAQLLCRRAPA